MEPLREKKYYLTRSITSLLYNTIDNIDKFTLYDVERLSCKVHYDINIKIDKKRSYTVYSTKINLISKIESKSLMIEKKFGLRIPIITLIEISILYATEVLI